VRGLSGNWQTYRDRLSKKWENKVTKMKYGGSMARYKPYKYDQMVMIPISFQDQLEPGTLEYTINELVEHHIDPSVFEARYQNDSTGAKAIHPKLLLKVILFGYSRGMISSRQIERACGENILFMALSGGCRPDHSTLAHFVSSMQKEIESIFGNILLVCDELDLLGGTHFSLDGVKLPSNASKEWSGTFKELKKKRAKLQEKLQQVITEHIRQDGLSNSATDRHQQQEKRLLHLVERLNEFLQEEKPKIGKGRKEIQSNLTDHQSAKMPTSHGVIQGYNAQALVDGKRQVIVHAEAFASQDHDNLAPMLERAKKNMQDIGKTPDYFKGRQLTADSNYYSYANLVLCQAESLDAYIPDMQFRKRDQRFIEQQRFKNGIHSRKRSTAKEKTFTAADFVFDDSKQAYLCPQGKVLKRGARSQRNRYRVYDIYRARQEDCACCQVRSRCLSKPDTPRRNLSVEVKGQQPSLIEQMKAKIDAMQGKQIYARRLAIVEPVFANIRIQKRLDHFTLRSKAKVDVQWKLFALLHNIGKIHHYGLAQ
jgi:transposase